MIFLSNQNPNQFPRENTSFPTGVTLIELLISVAILGILSAVAIASYVGTQRQAVLDSTAEQIVVYLRSSQQKSISQEEGLQWGVHFENPTSSNPFFALFTGSPYSESNVRERIFLPLQLKYLVPSDGLSIDVIYAKMTGVPNSTTSVEITFKSESAGTSRKKVINVNAIGVPTVQ